MAFNLQQERLEWYARLRRRGCSGMVDEKMSGRERGRINLFALNVRSCLCRPYGRAKRGARDRHCKDAEANPHKKHFHKLLSFSRRHRGKWHANCGYVKKPRKSALQERDHWRNLPKCQAPT
jgi:hypothetical protein